MCGYYEILVDPIPICVVIPSIGIDISIWKALSIAVGAFVAIPTVRVDTPTTPLCAWLKETILTGLDVVIHSSS